MEWEKKFKTECEMYFVNTCSQFFTLFLFPHCATTKGIISQSVIREAIKTILAIKNETVYDVTVTWRITERPEKWPLPLCTRGPSAYTPEHSAERNIYGDIPELFWIEFKHHTQILIIHLTILYLYFINLTFY